MTKASTFDQEVRQRFEQQFKTLGIKDFIWDDLDVISRAQLGIAFVPEDPDKLAVYRQATDPTKTGTIFNEISLYTSYIRDQAVVEKLARLKRQYHRVMIEMGASHYYTIEPYLKGMYS